MKNDVSGQEIAAGLWWLKHKELIRKITTIVVLVVCVVIIVNLVYQLIYFFIDLPKLNQYLEEMSEDRVNFVDAHQQIAPIPLEVTNQGAVENRDGEFDLYAKVKNHNQNWAAAGCEYYYAVSGDKTNFKNAYFLPAEEKYLLDFAFPSADTTRVASLKVEIVLENCQWQRINEPDSLVKVDFLIENEKITQGVLVEDSFKRSSENANTNLDISGFPTTNINARPSGSNLTQLSLDLTNKSIYGFWEVGVSVILSYQGEIVGVNYLSLDRFLSLKTRNLVFNWPKYFSRSANVEVYIETDVLDEDNLIGLGE